MRRGGAGARGRPASAKDSAAPLVSQQPDDGGSPAHPVRIKLDNPSSDIRLTVDRTATVLMGSSDGGR